MAKKPALFIAIAVVAFLSFLIVGTLNLKKVRVEACMEFNGRTECRIAGGPTAEQALRTAVENACAVLASGMTESMACDHTPPKSVKQLD